MLKEEFKAEDGEVIVRMSWDEHGNLHQSIWPIHEKNLSALPDDMMELVELAVGATVAAGYFPDLVTYLANQEFDLYETLKQGNEGEFKPKLGVIDGGLNDN